ncbi:unnamed protein product [Schistocephalus solidus]|uniref:ARID domain-containing protein n=1 Tax=Schistocephalus solidus TaxID=70667 RepID=A0A183SLR0_SCHSO|nr:unnamed protein product [Schistocephalus solidus]
MAKQVLDLYELYRLVVTRGGLVEVINKKLWREITKGLQLPSSITSAAFTLRTQYMKYLYPYECEKLGLSTPSELQAAIDGNRREARRSSYSFEYPMLIAGRGGGAPASGNPPNAPSSSTCSSLLASSGGSPLSMSCLPSCAAQSASASGLLPPPPLGSSPTQLAGLHSHFLQPGYHVPSHLLPPGMLHSVAALSSGLLPPPGLPSPLSASGHRNPGMPPPPPPPPPGLSGLFPTLHHGFESTNNQSTLLPSGFHSASGCGVVTSSAAAAAAVAASMFGFAAAGAPSFSSSSLNPGADFGLPHFTSASAAKSFLQTTEKEHGLHNLAEASHDVPNSVSLTTLCLWPLWFILAEASSK